jgi:biotin operon repressor
MYGIAHIYEYLQFRGTLLFQSTALWMGTTGTTMPKRPAANRTQRRYEPLDALTFIVTYRERNSGWSPSERQIQQALGISGASVAHHILCRLERAGLLTIIRYGRGYRSQLIPTEAGQTVVQLWQEGQDGAQQGASSE